MSALARMAGFIADNLIPVACAAIILTALGWALAEFFTAPEGEADVSRLDEWDARAELHCLDDWADHPANRADIARTRRQESGRRDMERIWHDATGGGSDAA